MKVNKNIKLLYFITCRNNGRKEEGTSVSLSTSASLSYLHESSSNLNLHTNYIKRKEKPKLRNGKLG